MRGGITGLRRRRLQSAAQYLRNRVFRGQDPGSTPADELARQERADIVARLMQQAVIEYAEGW